MKLKVLDTNTKTLRGVGLEHNNDDDGDIDDGIRDEDDSGRGDGVDGGQDDGVY
jgi:hypothetical protein